MKPSKTQSKKSASPHKNGTVSSASMPRKPKAESSSPQRQHTASSSVSEQRQPAPARQRQASVSANVRRRSKKRRRARKKKIFSFLLLLILIAVLAAIGAFLVYTLKGGSFFDPVQPYAASREFGSGLTDKESQKAAPFAGKLCVGSKDVPLDSVSLGAEQKGILFDLDNRDILYAKGMYDRVYPASITKIMTAILALKNGNLDDTITITQENITLEEGSQVCGFQAGDQVTLNQLLHCLLVYSGNDAASAIAGYVGGSTESFVKMMNKYAARLGCTGTHFTNPHGLQDDNHYTTPYDIYLMLNAALKYPEFTRITKLSSYTVEYTRADGTPVSTVLPATDHYLTGEAVPPKNVTVLGGKTGTTSKAGNCLAILVQNAYGKPYVSIVMGAETKDLLYQQMNSLLVNVNPGS